MKEWIDDKIDDFICYFSRAQHAYFDFIYGVKNLVKWFPVVWKNRGWDYCFMFPLWEKQFEEMERSFSKANGFIVGNKKRLERIRICKEICKRLGDDFWYHDNLFMFHDRKWGVGDFRVIDGKFELCKENVKTPEDEALETKQFLNLCKMEENHKKEDMQMLLNYIGKYWQTWWW